MDNSALTTQRCIPCEGAVKPLTPEQFSHYLPMVPEWKVIEGKKIERDMRFKNFAEAIAFINIVAKTAEDEGHHPDIFLHNWNKIRFSLMTHAIKGLFLNDFILAAKIDSLYMARER